MSKPITAIEALGILMKEIHKGGVPLSEIKRAEALLRNKLMGESVNEKN